jgi:hypothetical protein
MARWTRQCAVRCIVGICIFIGIGGGGVTVWDYDGSGQPAESRMNRRDAGTDVNVFMENAECERAIVWT